MKSNFIYLLLLSGIIFITSCGEENMSSGVKLGAITSSGETVVPNGRVAATNDLTFNSGSIVIREVVFDGDNENESVSRTIEQIATIDYATGTVTPEVIVDVPAGNYTSVNLGIELQDDGDDPSVVIEGTYVTSDDVETPIRFEFNSGEVFEAEAASVSIPAGTNVVGKISFDAVDWFSVVSISQLDNASLTDGVIVISSSSNAAIFDIVADRLDVATEAIFE